jgi:hypothetical protein
LRSSENEFTITEATTGLLYQPLMMMDVDGFGQSVECLAGKTEVLGEKLPQCLFDLHKFHII